MRLYPLLLSLLCLSCAPFSYSQNPVQIVGPESGLKNPFGVVFDDEGGMIIAEYLGGRLWKHTKGKGLQRLAEDVPFNGMHNVVRTRSGDLYISDTRGNYIRKLNEKTGKATIVSGTGESGYNGDNIPASKAMLADPISISLSPDDKRLYIADIRNFRVRVIDLSTGIINTVAGNGKSAVHEDGSLAKESPLLDPRGVAEDSKGNLYILSRKGHALRVVRPNGRIYTIAGTGEPHAADGPALKAGMKGPKHLCIDTDDTVIIADAENHRIMRYNPNNKTLLTILDRGPGNTPLNRPHGVWVRPNGALYICDSWNDRILALHP